MSKKPYRLGIKIDQNAIGWAAIEMGNESGSDAINKETVNLIENIVTTAIARIKERSRKHGLPSDIAILTYKNEDDLYRYRPDMKRLGLAGHQELCQRLKKSAEAMGISVRLVQMEPALYEAWRGQKPDSEMLRAEWAAS